jgi:hypothetical protein
MRVRGNMGLFLVQQLLDSTLFFYLFQDSALFRRCNTAPVPVLMHCRTVPYLDAACNTALTWAQQHGALLGRCNMVHYLGAWERKTRKKMCFHQNNFFLNYTYFCIITFSPVTHIFWNVLHGVKESPSSLREKIVCQILYPQAKRKGNFSCKVYRVH